MELDESQNIEFKKIWKDDYLKWICAFANTVGGKLFFGVDDNGIVVHLKDYKKLLEDLPNKIANILGISVEVNLMQEKENKYLEVVVNKSNIPISYKGQYFKRVGTTTQEIRGNELNLFLLNHMKSVWDDEIEETATLDDINFETIERFKITSKERLPFMAEESDYLKLLEKLNLTRGNKLKRSAILLFGKEPTKFYTGAFLKIGRFENEIDLLSTDIVKGNLIEQFETAIEILKNKYLTINISFDGINRIEKLEYPIQALREILVNAIIHKKYTGVHTQIKVFPNKIIVWNDGALIESLTIEKLFESHPSKPRNERIADVFFYSSYIDAWGRGIQKITEACKEYTYPRPDFKEDFGGFQVTLLKDYLTNDYLKEKNLNERQIKAVFYVRENKKISNSEYQKLNDISRQLATKELRKLVEIEIFNKSGKSGKGSFYTLKLIDY